MEKQKSVTNQVFISYALEDKRIVEKLYKGLKQKKLNLWWDKVCLNKKKDLENEIAREVSESRFILFCISKNTLRKIISKTHRFVNEELNIAYNATQKRNDTDYEIIIVQLDGSHMQDNRIKSCIQFDLYDDFKKCIDNLSTYIHKKIAQTSVKEGYKKNIHNQLTKSMMAHHAGDYKKALKILDQIIGISPENYDAWNNRGAIMNELSRHQKALDAFNKAVEISPKAYEAWNNMGVALYSLHKFDEAVDIANKALDINKNFHDAWVTKSTALIGAGRYKNAIEIIKEGLNKVLGGKGKSYLWNNMGVALMNSYQLIEAEKAFRTAIKLNPDYDLPHKNLEFMEKNKEILEEKKLEYIRGLLTENGIT
ncbi:MAG: tetratricopeptide repeat protein [Candidatus Aminicenantes bacterium]|nr:tetratricopeptide repeat protein [Candidatus Aminicenantes bacterium]NIM84074.1 tetratricopeptide repeat protein [Candidatus Aminicenantes bacterium]NIN23537.1 tetratricopeptide repeat protein [Candidatus Aminicenantes bacterium]NIN47242.1 tetratricopeptide repeat protein [Candidatus Aminicenantes bacterium]NIN90169.1 tetratricopeptide repeat protein [Candidatus Aminicenantes bacterium]